MQSKLRTKIAAAALMLAPVAALVAAQPAAAQPRYDDHRYEQDRDWRDQRDQRDQRDWRDHRDDRDHRDFRGDRRAPEITSASPGMDERVSDRGVTWVIARYRDDGSGVDGRLVRLRVDGRDVTRWAHADDNDIRFSADLQPGRHFVELQVPDRAGNVAVKSWSFTVVAGPVGDRVWD